MPHLLNELKIVQIVLDNFDFGLTLYENKNTISLDYVETIWLVAEDQRSKAQKFSAWMEQKSRDKCNYFKRVSKNSSYC